MSKDLRQFLQMAKEAGPDYYTEVKKPLAIDLEANVLQEKLAKEGIRARVLSMHTLKPLDVESILSAAQETGIIITVEEHNLIGGLGSAVAEVLAEHNGLCNKFKMLAVQDPFCGEVGSQEYLRDIHGLSIDKITDSALSLMN